MRRVRVGIYTRTHRYTMRYAHTCRAQGLREGMKRGSIYRSMRNGHDQTQPRTDVNGGSSAGHAALPAPASPP